MTARDTAFDAQVKWTIARPLDSAPGERYAYSNASYLLLGAIVEEATGTAYETHCRDAVLARLGSTGAMLDPPAALPVELRRLANAARRLWPLLSGVRAGQPGDRPEGACLDDVA